MLKVDGSKTGKGLPGPGSAIGNQGKFSASSPTEYFFLDTHAVVTRLICNITVLGA